MPQHWTVREAVTFSNMLKQNMPKQITKTDYDKFMDSLLQDLGLLHVAETKIGGPAVRGLSGGQKRRVSLARGMAANPNVMFCDEPTSGLSSTDAEACVKALKLLVKKWGITILVVIHQPRVEVAMLFDQLVLLTSQPGRVVYNGLMKDAKAHWEADGYPVPVGCNPADHYLDLVTPGAPGAVPDVFREYYIKHQKPKVLEAVAAAETKRGKDAFALLEEDHEIQKKFGDVPAVRRSKFGVSFAKQFKLVFNRKVKLSMIDMDFIGTVIFMQIFIGIFIGLIYFDVGNKEPKGFTQLGFLFMFLNMAMMVPAFVAPAMISERNVMKLECSEALYSEWAHIIASSAVNAAMLLTGFVVMCVVMFALSLIPWSAFGITLYWSFLNFLVMDACTAMCAAMAKSVEQATSILLPFQMLVGLFNGLTLTKKSAPGFLKPMMYVSPLSLAIEGIAWDTYGSDAAIWQQLQHLNGYDEGQPVAGAAICVGLAIVFRLGQVYALKNMHNIAK
jgi:ATP-binding cassette subfamily G (WHITE) protein 2